MNTGQDSDRLALLVERLSSGKENEAVEFKRDNDHPHEIGEYISALANSAALAEKEFAYVIWGIEDGTRAVIGTHFTPSEEKVGNEELENWLVRALQPQATFRFYEFEMAGRAIVLLEIPAAFTYPVRFKGEAFIRVGSYKKKLTDHPEKERQLWSILNRTSFEEMVAVPDAPPEVVLHLLDYPAYFELLKQPLPEDRVGILRSLAADDVIRTADSGRWHITNLGALLLARDLEAFNSLRRKAVRIIVYRGTSRVETMREQMPTKGYATGFEGLLDLIMSLLPANEVIQTALRHTVPMYPDLAVRELVANSLIHQDFSLTGTGPMVEIFADRMEITNPGQPLVQTERFLDMPPRSRNERFASFMRRIGVCEERGSGIDKVVFETEFLQLPAPDFSVVGDSTRATLFSHRPLTQMDRSDRVRACYLHACLKYVNRDSVTNSSLRQRFGIEPRNSATASRLIREAVEAGAIRAYDDAAAKKLMRYVPFWA